MIDVVKALPLLCPPFWELLTLWPLFNQYFPHAVTQILLYQPSQVISVTVVLGDSLVSQICQAMSPDNNLRATGPRAPVSRDRCCLFINRVAHLYSGIIYIHCIFNCHN